VVTDERLQVRAFVHVLIHRLEEMPRRRGDCSRKELRSVLEYWDNVDEISEVIGDPMADWAEQLVDAFQEVAQR
jgi:hypothetical protein